MAKVLQVPHDFSPSHLHEATECIKRGGVLAVATESFYALAGSALNQDAVERVASLKGARSHKPILVLIGHPNKLSSLVPFFPPGTECLIQKFWPGPVTLVLPACSHLPSALTCQTETIGVRQPGDSRLLTLLCATGPLTGTSANHSGDSPAQTADDVKREFGQELDLILDTGPAPGGMPSTIVNLVGEIRIIREGPIDSTTLQRALSDVRLTLAI